MPDRDDFDRTFAALRAILAPHGRRMRVLVDRPGDYQIAARDKLDRAGRPLFIAAVQTKKSYVSFHLLPIYMNPKLATGISPALRKRMQGKACFNFKTVDREQLTELKAITRTGIEAMKTIRLPWDK